MDERKRSKALAYSTIDGALSAVMGSLAGGMFLMGYAIKILKANPGQIGILAALPMFANLVQIFGSIIIEKTGKKKSLCFLSVFLSRILWMLIISLPFAIFAPLSDIRIWVLIAVIGLSSVFGSIGGVSWLAWMSDLVPENIRGSYFGKRNMIASACGMVVVLLGGKFITMWEKSRGADDPFGFIILFVVGLVFGLLAVFFLSRIPEVEKEDKAVPEFNFNVFLKPLKDKNFLTLTLFVSAWLFGVQLAAPFYGVYMIDILKVDFSAITIFGTFATFATLIMMKIWGPIADKLGNKPIIIVAGLVMVTVPFIWILAVPGVYYIPVMLAHILTGAFMAGAGLSQFNILIKLSPQEGRSVYLALFAAITGIFGAVSPILGGALSNVMKDISFTAAGYTVSNLHIIFLISALVQGLTIFFILKVKEEGAATPVAVIMQLGNDLNPQTGIAGASDFIMVNVEKTDNILKKVDKYTDDLADKSEDAIERAINKGESIIKKPLDKIKEFFKEN